VDCEEECIFRKEVPKLLEEACPSSGLLRSAFWTCSALSEVVLALTLTSFFVGARTIFG
jgi:hypothetical protein